MALEVRIPRDDAPRPWSLALVAALGLGLGVGLAAWAAEPESARERDARRAAAREPVDDEGGEHANTSAGDEAASGDEGAAVDDVASADHEAASADEGAAAGDVASADHEAASADEGAAAGDDASADHDAASTDEGAAVGEVASANDGSDEGADEAASGNDDADEGAVGPAPAALTVVRGRVAYLRCDGLRQRRGPYPCPRDEALEAAVWPIVDAITACATAPDRPGEADLRLEYRGAAAPDVGWRDTFPDDAVRLDRDRVLGCVRTALRGTRQSLGAERMLVSFRFSLIAS